MTTLHIYKSEPDETAKELSALMDSGQDEPKILLYEPDIDWGALVDDIFSADKVICWW